MAETEQSSHGCHSRSHTEVRAMAEYHVGGGMFSIYAGTLKKNGMITRRDTDEN